LFNLIERFRRFIFGLGVGDGGNKIIIGIFIMCGLAIVNLGTTEFMEEFLIAMAMIGCAGCIKAFTKD